MTDKRLLPFLKANKPNVVRKYDQRIFTLDVENSNGYIIDGVARPFDYSRPPSFYADKEKVSCLYLWQFGVNDMYFYGRTLDTLKPALDYLATRPYRSVAWIHNASHEFNFLLNILEFDEVFARKPHQILKLVYGNLEFHCTYMLTRQSLENMGKSIGCPKLVGAVNYDDIITPETELDPNELKYGIRDIEIVYKRVLKFRDEYRYIQKIPLTQTGRPRNEVKKIYQKDISYHYKMTALLPRTLSEYTRLRKAFVGGWVHANYFYNNVNIKDSVRARDITSSYPTQMVLKPFPMSPWTLCRNRSDFEFYLKRDDFLCLLEVEFRNVESRGFNDYWSYSKMTNRVEVKQENGRVYKAKSFTVTMTEIDYKIMLEAYKCEPHIINLWYSTAGYLDKRYVEYILKLYNDKVLLTGIPEKAELRARSKEILNSLYGMMVSAIIYDDLVFTGTEFESKYDTHEEIIAAAEKKLADIRAKPYKVILSYSHGLFVTSHARKQLFDLIKNIDRDVVYHDTDSIYYIGDHEELFNRFNEQIKADLVRHCKARGIDPALLHPKDPNGDEQWLGIYTADYSEPLHEFKTLGSKRYCYRVKEGDPIKITVSGVNKKTGVAALGDSVDNFKDGLVFGYKDCGKLIPHYRTDQHPTKWIDRDGNEYICRDRFGVTLQPTRYILGREGDFITTLENMGSLSNYISELTYEELDEIEKNVSRETLKKGRDS